MIRKDRCLVEIRNFNLDGVELDGFAMLTVMGLFYGGGRTGSGDRVMMVSCTKAVSELMIGTI